MLLEIGCSENDSNPERHSMTSFSVLSPKGMTSVTIGVPFVSVRVLSKAIAFILPNSSRKRPPLITTPFFEALPTAEKTLTGVEITRAHGHEIIRSVRA